MRAPPACSPYASWRTGTRNCEPRWSATRRTSHSRCATRTRSCATSSTRPDANEREPRYSLETARSTSSFAARRAGSQAATTLRPVMMMTTTRSCAGAKANSVMPWERSARTTLQPKNNPMASPFTAPSNAMMTDPHRDLAGLDEGDDREVAEVPVMVVGLLLRHRETVVVQRLPRPGDVGEVEQLRRRVRFHRREERPIAVDRGVPTPQPGDGLDLRQRPDPPREVGAETTGA